MEMQANRYELYFSAFKKAIGEYEDNGPVDNLKKVVFSAVKFINSMKEPKTKKEAEMVFQFASIIKGMVGLLTPKQFMNMFPIKKDFRSGKWGIKDYFYTVDYIKNLDPDKPIGNDDALLFLSEYTNDDIDVLHSKIVHSMSLIRQYDGHLSLGEEFLASQGMETPNTFRNQKGDMMYIRKGKPIQITTVKQSHLSLVN